MPNKKQIEAAALAIATLEQCGVTVDGKRVLCDDPKLGEAVIDPCYCRVIARAALEAAEGVKPIDAYERAFDAAGAYLNEQYGNRALFNPIDRARILSAITTEGDE